MARRSAGVAGSAVLVGAAGLYLAYVGVRDVPFFAGLSELLRGTPPTSKQAHTPYIPKNPTVSGGGTGKVSGAAGDSGIEKLVGNAAAAYPAMRALAPGRILGWGLRPSGTSDHPRGKALDVMTGDPIVANQVISLFRSQPGARYWIWNRQIANREVDNWRPRPYNSPPHPSPHTDHVHLSYD